jgi:hypothetical protein
MISNRPGPYTVRLSLANSSVTDLQYMKPEPGAQVEICDDFGRCEKLQEVEEGVFRTKDLIGEVGRTYHLKISTLKGKVYKSVPETLLPPGKLSDLRYEISDFPKNGFDVYVDATLPTTDSVSFMKFDWNGVYEVLTFPALRTRFLPSMRRDDLVRVPYPTECSGLEFIVLREDPLDTLLVRRTVCSCCTCWVEDEPSIPVITESTYLKEPSFSNVLVTRVPIDRRTMYTMYKLKIVSQSISRNAYRFWNAVKQQKVGAADLFQPPIGYIPGNIISTDANDKVFGLFYAASASDTVTITFNKGMVPFDILPIDTAMEDCRKVYRNATNQKPFGW